MLITRKTDGNFGNISEGVVFSKVAYQRKRYQKETKFDFMFRLFVYKNAPKNLQFSFNDTGKFSTRLCSADKPQFSWISVTLSALFVNMPRFLSELEKGI